MYEVVGGDQLWMIRVFGLGWTERGKEEGGKGESVWPLFFGTFMVIERCMGRELDHA